MRVYGSIELGRGNYEVVDATTVDTAVQEAETAQRLAQRQGRQEAETALVVDSYAGSPGK